MKRDQNFVFPPVFFKPGNLHPIQFSYVAPYPYGDGNVYAIYINGQTTLPERIHYNQIQNSIVDFEGIYLKMLSNAESRVATMIKNKKTYFKK